MRHLSLFNGIGGFQLAAHWAGWENIAHVEIDEWCNKVVAQHFPKSKCYTDIKEFNGKEYEGAIDIISGGFPCQPFSTAGKRKGEEDSRNLWPEYLRIIQEVKPTYVIGENVAGLLSMEDGRTLEGIFSDLEGEGYTVESFIIPAAGVGAWHRRDRIWIVGYPKHHGQLASEGRRKQQESLWPTRENQVGRAEGADSPQSGIASDSDSDNRSPAQGHEEEGHDRRNEPGRTREDVPDSQRERLQVSKTSGQQQPIHDVERRSVQAGAGEIAANTKGIGVQECRPTGQQESQTHAGQGLSMCSSPRNGASYWSSEPGMGRMVTRISRRVDRIKGLGNAIVPQVAFEIFKVIKIHYDENSKTRIVKQRQQEPIF